MNPITKASLVLAVFFSVSQAAASQTSKSLILTPNNDITLNTVVSYIGSYRQCMDHAQQQLQQNHNGRGNNAFNNARQNQCQHEHLQLAQSIDKQSLKAINKLVKKRWKKREVGPGFTPERILQNPTALNSGINVNRVQKAR